MSQAAESYLDIDTEFLVVQLTKNRVELHCDVSTLSTVYSNVWTGLRRLMAASSQAGAGLYCAVASGLAGARHGGVETTGNGRGPEACLLCGLILGPEKSRRSQVSRILNIKYKRHLILGESSYILMESKF